MRVDQAATATPTVSALTPTRPVKDETRTQVAAARTEATSSTRVDGLRVSISDAARQAANTASAASTAQAGAESAAAADAQAASTAQPQSLIEGVPWPVGVGPPRWLVTQGAAGATALVAPKVPEQSRSESRAPADNEAARETPQTDASAQVAAQAQANAVQLQRQTTALAQNHAESEPTKAKPAVSGTVATAGRQVESRDETARLAERRKASAVYSSDATKAAQPNPALNLKV